MKHDTYNVILASAPVANGRRESPAAPASSPLSFRGVRLGGRRGDLISLLRIPTSLRVSAAADLPVPVKSGKQSHNLSLSGRDCHPKADLRLASQNNLLRCHLSTGGPYFLPLSPFDGGE